MPYGGLWLWLRKSAPIDGLLSWTGPHLTLQPTVRSPDTLCAAYVDVFVLRSRKNTPISSSKNVHRYETLPTAGDTLAWANDNLVHNARAEGR